jgi:hypothetical protein
MLLTPGTRREAAAAREADTARADAPAPDAGRPESGFRRWRRSRPLVGGILIALGGLEMFLSSQLDLGNIRIQLGIEGLQATIIPIVLVLLGVLVVTMPTHRIFYGVIALAVAIYSLVGVNLGGFLLGMLLSTVGGILAVAWMPRDRRAKDEPARRDASEEDEEERTVDPEELFR